MYLSMIEVFPTFWSPNKTIFILVLPFTVKEEMLIIYLYQKYIYYDITHYTIYFTSVQRAYILFDAIKITKNYKLRPLTNFLIEAAKHGPAFGVIPVLMPDQPSFNILFVFYHLNNPHSFSSDSPYSSSFLKTTGLRYFTV